MPADALARKFEVLARVLDERTRRLVAAAEAQVIGFGGVTAVARASGLSRGTVIRGIAELKTAPKPARGQRVRRQGAGRKRTVDRDATLKRDLEALVEPVTRGDPESPLRWTCKSVRQLASELQRLGHRTSHRMVAELLHQMDYSLQANRKTLEGSSHPDRDAQFHHISDKIREFQADHQPVLSVDTKKKELVGDFKNNGRELRPKGDPEKVRVHDFVIPELGRAAPYGVYDVTQNAGWVSVGVDHDRPPSPPKASGGGGSLWGMRPIPERRGCSSQRIPVGATALVSVSGSWNCKGSPTTPDCKSRSAICHREPANGIRSNTGCFPISAKTGGANL